MSASKIASKNAKKLRLGRSVELNIRILVAAAKKAGHADTPGLRNEFKAIVTEMMAS